jgi:hypothetical protein
MTDEMHTGATPRLRAVGDAPVADAATLAEAAARCVEAVPAGLPRRALGAAVAARLGIPVDAVEPDALATALGLLIATGRVDESAGRLVPVAQERREAG